MLGKNGVGKSTFLKALIFDKSKSNKIIINNKKSNDLSLSLRVNYFGLHPGLIPGLVLNPGIIPNPGIEKKSGFWEH